MLKYCPPSRYDSAPYGTICKVMGDGECFTLYIQSGYEEIHWVRVGEFLEELFKAYLHDDEFIKNLLHHHEALNPSTVKPRRD